jgi:hypothetical protein
MRDEDRQYFERLESRLDEAFDVAETAKERSGDPQPEVEIPVAQDMADRVENILGIEIVAERVRELEGEMSREEAALELAKDFADGNVGDYETRAGKIEGAVRTAVALLTEGVVAAPIEGIDRVELLENDDGTEFVNVSSRTTRGHSLDWASTKRVTTKSSAMPRRSTSTTPKPDSSTPRRTRSRSSSPRTCPSCWTGRRPATRRFPGSATWTVWTLTAPVVGCVSFWRKVSR